MTTPDRLDIITNWFDGFRAGVSCCCAIVHSSGLPEEVVERVARLLTNAPPKHIPGPESDPDGCKLLAITEIEEKPNA